MAKKKRKTKTNKYKTTKMAKRRRQGRRHRRSRVSGIAGMAGMNFNIMKIAGAGAGGFGAKALNKVVPDTLDKKMVAGGKMLIGAVLASINMKGKDGGALEGAGLGMVAVGTNELLSELGVMNGLGIPADDDTLAVAIEGIEDVEFEDLTERVNGGESVLAGDESVLAGDDIPVINGDDIPVINGDDESYI